jgi:hypothetical protein
MPLTAPQATDLIKKLFPLIKKHLLNNQEFKLMGLYPMVPELLPDDPDLRGENWPDATLGTYTKDGQDVCRVTCNPLLLNFSNANAIKFGLAHELGHAFSLPVVERLGMVGVDGPRVEVIADLGAAYVLTLSGMSWADVLAAAKAGNVPHGIFASTWGQAGDEHPPGDHRVKFVVALNGLMERKGKTFDAATKEIMTKLAHYAKGSQTAPDVFDPWEHPHARFPDRESWQVARDSAGVAKHYVKASVGDLLEEIGAFFQAGDNTKLEEKLQKLRQKDPNAFKAKFADKLVKLYSALGEYSTKLTKEKKEKKFIDYVGAIRRLVLVCAAGPKDSAKDLVTALVAVDKDVVKAVEAVEKDLGLPVTKR